MSFQSKKWATYQDGEYSFLHDNQIYQSIFSFTAKYTNKISKIQIQQIIDQNDKNQISSKGDIRMQFPLGETDRSIYSRINSNGKFGIYYDHGLLEFNNGQAINFYSGFQTNRSFSSNVYKVGASLVGKYFNYGVRFRYDSNPNSLLVHLRGFNNGQLNNHNWRINFYSLMDPRISRIIKNGILLGLNHENKKDNFYLRIESGKRKAEGLHWCQLFNNYRVNWTRKLSQTTKIGAQVLINCCDWKKIFNNTYLGGEWRHPEHGITVNAKINSHLTNALTITHDLVGFGTYSFGFELSSFGNLNNFKFGTGISLEF